MAPVFSVRYKARCKGMGGGRGDIKFMKREGMQIRSQRVKN